VEEGNAVPDRGLMRGDLKRARPAWVGLALILLPAAVLAAGAKESQIEKTFDTTRSPRVSIANLVGEVTVRGWDKAQVHAAYSVLSPRVEVDTEVLPPTGAAEKVHFTTHVLDPMIGGNEKVVHYILDVPEGASVEIRNPQGGVHIERLQADDASVESVGGTIGVTDFSGHLTVRSVGGNIQIIRPSGRVEAYSITGNLHFVSPMTSRLRGSTTSGHILFEGDFGNSGDYSLSDYSGDIEIYCPAAASFELRAKTYSGKLENDFPLTTKKQSATPLSSGNSLLGMHNSGKATVELTSFSGTIRIRQQQ
jgi:hypothetical protein